MKRPLLTVALGFALAAPCWAQSEDSGTPPPPPAGEHRHGPMLTADEKTELKSAHEAAIKADPTLESDGKALHEQMMAFEKKMHDAMIAADPKVQPILTKLERAHHHHGPPPEDGGGN